LADEAAESGWLSSELAIGIRRVKGVKRLGRRIGNWLTGDQAQGLLNAISQSTLRGRRDAALIGLLLGCGLRRSEAVNLRFDQLQLRESHCVIVDMVGKGGRLRTVPVPPWCKGLIDVWLRDSRVTEGKVFRRVSKNGARQDGGVTSDVVWYAVKQYAKRIGVDRLAPHDLQRLTPLHEAALADAMRLIVHFSERTGIPVGELSETAKPKLTNFTSEITERMATAANRMSLSQMLAQARGRFDQRVENALKDVEIGFIQGRSAFVTENSTNQSKALRLLKALYDATRAKTEPVVIGVTPPMVKYCTLRNDAGSAGPEGA
jgi:hypothetical protein